jgi:hypothetical protein
MRILCGVVAGLATAVLLPQAARGGLLAVAAAADQRESDAPQQVTLATVATGSDGRLVLTTTEGVVWRQVESTAVRPTPTQGKVMTIERTSAGGFLCRFGKWVEFRCFRAR